MLRHSVLARSTTLTHPIGTQVTTPLLVPSFSSKGLGSGPAGAKEVGKLLDVSKEQLTDVLFVDSGGYETSQYQDLSTTFVPETKARAWSEAKVREVYDTWPDYIPAVFVSYDQRGAVRHQARRALAQLSRYPRHLHAF